MKIADCAAYLEKTEFLHDTPGPKEVMFGGKRHDSGYWTLIYHSAITKWSQVLFYCANPKSEVEILRIDYYPTALMALMDNSIFPIGTIAWIE